MHSNDALILKYDSDKNFLLIKFDGNKKAFEKAEFSGYSISTIKKGEEISIERGFLIIGNNLYKYNGSTFDKINVKDSFEEYINKAAVGKYPQGSMRILIVGELQLLSKHDLKIMRNEIFARYGYIFKEGGEMDKYFKSQDWYTPEHKNVNDFLTEIEKANMKLIREVEAE
ncbi:MAG: hypothetical protein C0599_17345 [Salinivirgaceae bacterium]|nr:MAG: hypothetical protein C0599_17345 [Salinivirgaceae bacterium]